MITQLIDKFQGKLPDGSKRSDKWPALRKQFLHEFPRCSVCGTEKNVQAHHVKPFHDNPELELDYTNLIPLCEGFGQGHHLLFGHLGSFRSYNENVLKDAEEWRFKISNRPK